MKQKKKIENDILAELEVLSSFDSVVDKFPIRPWPKEDDHEFKYLKLREYIFYKIDKSGCSLEDICQIINTKTIVFVNWYLDYLDIDIHTLTRLELFLNEKLFEIGNEKISRV
ncbi:MAG: hypothetical protein ACC656_06070 [Candidatus Heimdallarchaeota archaeon]